VTIALCSTKKKKFSYPVKFAGSGSFRKILPSEAFLKLFCLSFAIVAVFSWFTAWHEPCALSDGGENQMLLIVDDEAGIRESLEEFLCSEGFSVQTAANGSEALQLAREVLPTLILLDLNMPVLWLGIPDRVPRRPSPVQSSCAGYVGFD
jgi:hypothetical protein